MAESNNKRDLSHYARLAYKLILKNFLLTVSLTSFGLGGLLLLSYAWSIGQLPEFTWNDLSGTLLAVFVTGSFMVVFIVIYCLCAGYFSRLALETIYPEAANHGRGIPPNPQSPPPPYVRLIKGNFIPSVTGLSALFWMTALVIGISNGLTPYYRDQLIGSLLISVWASASLLLIDWECIHSRWARGSLVCILSGSVVTSLILFAAWSVQPAKKNPPVDNTKSKPFDWLLFLDHKLPYALYVGMAVVLIAAVLINIRAITTAIGRFFSWIGRNLPWKWPNWSVRAATWTVRNISVSAESRRLAKAKIFVMFTFCIGSTLVFIIAGAIAGAGDAHEVVLNFFVIAAFLALLNWLSFTVRLWRERVVLGLGAAAVIFLSIPLFTHNPILLPKMTVSLLGLGNEHLDTIGLSSQQCSTLAPYGVDCVANGEGSITLTNVNLLNRLGGSVVLELLLKDKSVSTAGTTQTAPGSKSAFSPDHNAPQSPARILSATPAMGPYSKAAKKCDDLLASQLDDSTRHALRCVTMLVPKDQVEGTTVSGLRTYNAGYSAYLPGRAKEPTAVELIDSDHAHHDQRDPTAVTSTNSQIEPPRK